MNHDTDESVRASARERMFDVELLALHEAACAGDAVPDEAMLLDDTIGGRRRKAPLLAIAVALVCLTVTVLIAWQRSSSLALAQDPAPAAVMPLCRFITKPQDFGTMPADSVNLGVYTKAIENYEGLTAFPDLRRLMVLGAGVPDPTVALLVPLGKLRKLEELELPLQTDLQPVHLRALAQAKNVQSLRLHCKRAITAADVRALKLMPRLRVLILYGGELDAVTVRSLSELPRLDKLSLQSVAGCTEEVLVELRTLHRLRSLTLSSLGKQPFVEQFSGTWTPGAGLTPAIARSLGELPLFDELELFSCKVTAEAIAALPTGMRRIHIARCPDVVPKQIRALLHCRGLTELSLDSHDIARWIGSLPQDFLAAPARTGEAQAELIRELPLRRFGYASAMPNAVRLAVTVKQSLTHVDLMWFVREDLEALANLKNLRHLTLNEGRVTDLNHLKVLRRCPSLKTLTVMYRDWKPAELEALLPGVKVFTNWQ